MAGQALAGLAHGLELDTVAEGVETRSEAEILAAHGWRHAQGYLFSRPLTASDMAPLLASDSMAAELPAAS